VVVDSTNPASTYVECMFEPGYSCTIDYGTDPYYTNLVYSDTSTTLGQVTTITLSQEIQRNTTYYFIVSANNSLWCERVRGTFRTGGWMNFVEFFTQYGVRDGEGHKMTEFGCMDFSSVIILQASQVKVGTLETYFVSLQRSYLVLHIPCAFFTRMNANRL